MAALLCMLGDFLQSEQQRQWPKEPRQAGIPCTEVEMKFALVVFLALGLTMAWQASVVADNNKQQDIESQSITESTALQAGIRDQRG